MRGGGAGEEKKKKKKKREKDKEQIESIPYRSPDDCMRVPACPSLRGSLAALECGFSQRRLIQ